ncbi:transposase [Streptomyces sp. S5]|uniref:transposase n=1 Tax=Streptomyces sp. S5 TaxID=1456735 RepID=UPI0023E3531B|nr:transposase [Streptomyces sp. S5]
MDAQSVKTSGNVAETSQGIDAGKKIKGRERHLITDNLGPVPTVLVTAASPHDSADGKQALTELAAAHGCHQGMGRLQLPRQRHPARRQPRNRRGSNATPKAKGFQPPPKRWAKSGFSAG